MSFGVAIVLPGEDEEDGDFLRGDPADMVGPDLADVGSGGASGYTLFLQANMRAFNGEGLLYDLVHFSAGNLFLPSELQGCREGDKVRLTWKNEYVVREERLGDELWCVVMMEDMRFRIVTPEAIESVRRDESAEIELSEERGKRIHLYCFFGSINRCDFSENLHLVL